MDANKKVHELLGEHIDALKAMAEALLEKETLGSEDLHTLLSTFGLAPEDRNESPAEQKPVETGAKEKEAVVPTPPPAGETPTPPNISRSEGAAQA